MQWRKWRLIARLWRIELDTKSGSLETSDFGENRQRAGDNGDNRPGPLETGNFGENGECSEIGDFFWYPECGKYSNWMPRVAPSN